MQNILIIYYFSYSNSKIVFEYESLDIFAGNTQKYSCPPPPPLLRSSIYMLKYYILSLPTFLKSCILYKFYSYSHYTTYILGALSKDREKAIKQFAAASLQYYDILLKFTESCSDNYFTAIKLFIISKTVEKMTSPGLYPLPNTPKFINHYFTPFLCNFLLGRNLYF